MKAPSEKHLEDWIVENVQYLGDVFEIGDIPPTFMPFDVTYINETQYIYPCFNRILKRQARFPSGIADLIAMNSYSIAAIELKAGAIDGEAIAQSLRYVHSLRQIYDSVCQDEYKRSQDVCDYYDYQQSIAPDRADLAVKGVVIGHSLKDKKLHKTADLVGVEMVLYDYDPETNWYTFDCQYQGQPQWEWDAYADFAEGIIGDGIREIVAWRTAYRKEKGWRNGK